MELNYSLATQYKSLFYMNILIILGHPDTDSFNHAIADTCIRKLIKNGHSVKYHDLYLEGFDPLINKSEIPKNGQIDNIVKEHCNDLINSDGIIVIHPNWWGQPPAILKGWIDRVIRPGIAYKFEDGDNGEGLPIGLLKAQTGLVFNTSNTSEEREDRVFKDPLDTIWRNCIFDFCGVKGFDRRMYRIVVTSDLKQRQAWLSDAELMIDKYFSKN
jgi:NAD(P)H dehydrogenase (quinone)